MKLSGILFFAFASALTAWGQHVINPKASVVDVASRQAALISTTDAVLRASIKDLLSCVATPFVPPPAGRMIIPHHYLSGSNGPTNPAEGPATRVYWMFESRITAGMNQYLATGSHAESACALAQLDAWAQANALLDYDRKESQQAWYQVEWTLSSAGITDSVLVNDSTLDPLQQSRVIAWLDTAARKDISFEEPSDPGNNHHYWRALAATSIGVASSDDMLFRFGINTYKQAIGEIDHNGAFPKEMARHENAISYQGFALQPLVLIAEFAARQKIDLYAYQTNGHTLRDAILFYGRSVDDPGLVKPYTTDPQSKGSGNFAAFTFYVARFGVEGLPPAILNALKHPAISTRIGGNTAIMAAKPEM
ncbi:MAG: alginate lyase family protein [Terracidiphilus sp.]|jgi:poly(beta-D-mannuronate) lyase